MITYLLLMTISFASIDDSYVIDYDLTRDDCIAALRQPDHQNDIVFEHRVTFECVVKTSDDE